MQIISLNDHGRREIGGGEREIRRSTQLERLVVNFISTLQRVQRSVKTFLPGFLNGWLKYCLAVHFRGGQRNILRMILGTQQECLYTTLWMLPHSHTQQCKFVSYRLHKFHILASSGHQCKFHTTSWREMCTPGRKQGGNN